MSDTFPLRLLRSRSWRWGWRWGARRAGDVGQHEMSRQRISGCGSGSCVIKRAAAASRDCPVYVTVAHVGRNVRCDGPATEIRGDCAPSGAFGLVLDEIPGAGPIARGADIIAQLRRMRPRRELMMHYCDQGEHGQQQRDDFGSFHLLVLRKTGI